MGRYDKMAYSIKNNVSSNAYVSNQKQQIDLERSYKKILWERGAHNSSNSIYNNNDSQSSLFSNLEYEAQRQQLKEQIQQKDFNVAKFIKKFKNYNLNNGSSFSHSKSVLDNYYHNEDEYINSYHKNNHKISNNNESSCKK